MTSKKYETKDIGGLLNEAIIGLQKLQAEVSIVDDEKRSIGVGLVEAEQKLHIISDLLEGE